VFLLAAFWCVPALRADKVPDWFQQLTKETLPEYPARTDGVVLLDDCTLTVKDAQSITKNCREVRKILRHEGRDLGQFHFDFNKDNKLTYLKGWSIGVKGQQYELKEKDAIEYRPFSEDILYDDARYKVLLMPAAEAGAYVAVESEQKERPYVLQDAWFFHKRIPIRKSRFTLLLPPNWEFEYRFANWKEFKPQRSGANQWTWEINDVPGFEEEDRMPDESAVTGHMVVSFYPPGRQGTRMSSWPDVGAWADSLNASRRVVTPAMHQRVLELTADARTPLGKIQALADFLQREIRYVAIEIRIGGIQAHMAGDIFSNRYGDCKDKATLLATMLGDVGIESYLVLVHTGHGVTVPETPYAYSFNHAILAIKLPEGTDASKLYAVVDDQKLGKLLIFDPTNQAVPVGLLPYYEEGNYALVVLPNGGQLVQLPLLAPNLNRRLRTGSLELQPDGAVSGQIDDLLTGNLAARMRRMLLDAKGTDRLKIVEDMFAENFGQYRLTSARQENLERYDQPLVLHYKFEALNYGQSAGGLMLVRPRVMGIMHWSDEHWGDAKAKPRQFPVILPMGPISESDAFDIKVPAGYEIDELPPPVEAVYPFAEYHSSTEMKDGVLRFRRKYVVKDVMIPLGQMEQFKNFEGRISDDEREMAVLKKSAAVSQAAPGTPK
jgi:transglutaminase-like putative cysteine protease